MDDLVKLLRGPAKIDDGFSGFYIFARDAKAGADRIEALEAELATARALIAELEANQACVKVKQLVWKEYLVSNGNRQIAYAVTPLCTYRITQKFFPDTFFSVEMVDGMFLSASTFEAAKDAAQADYERRILEALE